MLLPINRLVSTASVLSTSRLSWLSRLCSRALLLCLAVAWSFVGIPNAAAQALMPGTLVGWGYNGQGQTSPPAGLSGVTAIAAGGYHSLAANTTPVDTTPPTVTMVAPTQNARYLIQQRVPASYSCADPSTVTLCSGSVPVGTLIDTSRLGPKTFFVTATDGRGNTGSTLINYTVEAHPATLPPTTPPRRK